ncbi:MAG: RIP metalloprotease RseP [Oscillospiraceae bacterium]|nr:RIP metalloprotease RseP [Oscillospiraceae bacterium]
MSVFITAVASILIFGLVIFIHELGHFLTAKYSSIKVNEFALGMGPTLIKKVKGETTYALRLFPIGGFVSMEGEDEESSDEHSFQRAPVGNRILVVVAGACMNLLLGFLVLAIIVCMQTNITSRVVSGFYEENASTYQSGLRAGDEIVAVNGRRCFIADDIVYEFARTADGTADFTVKRDGQKIELKNVIFQTKQNAEGANNIVIDFYVQPIEKTPITVLKEAGKWTVSLARLVFLSLVDLVTGRVPVNELSGPVGIVSTISKVSSMGIRPLLTLLALITVNLGVFNLLPIPALDGGRLVFLMIEAIRKKPLNPKYEGVINTVGFGALMLLMLFVTFNDISRLLF